MRPFLRQRGAVVDEDCVGAANQPVGRPRETDLRSVVDAILYMASTGRQWRQLPKEFPPDSTVQGHFYAWSRIGVAQASPSSSMSALSSRR